MRLGTPEVDAPTGRTALVWPDALAVTLSKGRTSFAIDSRRPELADLKVMVQRELGRDWYGWRWCTSRT
jgi:hypothetical protein